MFTPDGLSLRCSEVVSRSLHKTDSFVKEMPFAFCSRKLLISLHPMDSLYFKLLQQNCILSGKIDFMGLLTKMVKICLTLPASKNMVRKPIPFLLSLANFSNFSNFGRFFVVDLYLRTVNLLSFEVCSATKCITLHKQVLEMHLGKV